MPVVSPVLSLLPLLLDSPLLDSVEVVGVPVLVSVPDSSTVPIELDSSIDDDPSGDVESSVVVVSVSLVGLPVVSSPLDDESPSFDGVSSPQATDSDKIMDTGTSQGRDMGREPSRSRVCPCPPRGRLRHSLERDFAGLRPHRTRT